jgi:hypothetical protein
MNLSEKGGDISISTDSFGDKAFSKFLMVKVRIVRIPPAKQFEHMTIGAMPYVMK